MNNFPKLRKEHQKAGVHSGKHLVVYIEDNSAIRQLVRYIMDTYSKIDLLEAETGAQGLEIIEKHRPELILVDIHLPDMDGFSILNQLKAKPDTANIPVVAISGKASPADILQGKAAGFNAFLAKPIVISEFTTMLNMTLGLKIQ
jgi:CheY-like chemotaxis protein